MRCTSSNPSVKFSKGVSVPGSVRIPATQAAAVACTSTGYHLVNLLLHVLVSVQVLWLARRLRPELPLGAELAALLFATHPVHTEAVCNTVGRAELLSAAFLLASTRGYAVAAAASIAGQDVLRGTVYYALACCTAVCAAWCKETGLLALVLGAAEDLLHQPPFKQPSSRGSSARTPAASTTQPKVHGTQDTRKSVPALESDVRAVQLPSCGWWMRTGIAASVAVLFLVDAKIRRGKRLTPAFSYVDNPISHGCQVPAELGTASTVGTVVDTSPEAGLNSLHNTLIGPPATPSLTRSLSGGYITAYYIWLLFWPVTLSPDYSFAAFPLVENLFDTRNSATVVMLIGLLGLGIWAIRQPAGSERVGSCMALLFLILPLLPACHLLLPVGTVLGERLLYVPSIGFCLLCGWAAEAAMAALQTRCWWTTLVAGAVLVSYATLTFRRSSVWYDDATLFRDAVLACPNSAKIHVTLGAIAMQEHNASAAEFHFERAVEIFPDYDDGLYSLGRLYFEGAVPEKQGFAAPLLLRAVEANPLHDKALDYYGQYLARSGRLREAETMMEKGLVASARTNLALLRNLAVVKNALGKVREGASLIAEAEAAGRRS